MTSITVLAPAKLNLFLKVLAKRKDGYHNLLTLFERISLVDEIKISKVPSGIIVSSDRFITRDPKQNIVYKAADIILKKARSGSGVKISINKTIPIAAGLGGGSSDAASVLMGINKLYNLRLNKKELLRLAKKLGADVPFFILETPFAIGRSIGNRLEKADLKLCLWHLIIYPGSKASTREIYEAFDARTKRLTTGSADDKISRTFKQEIDFNTAESMLYNNLEETAQSKKPVTGTILERLAYSTGRRAIITGSGPSVFCLCPSRKEAIEARKKFLGSVPAQARKDWQVFIAKTEK